MLYLYNSVYTHFYTCIYNIMCLLGFNISNIHVEDHFHLVQFLQKKTETEGEQLSSGTTAKSEGEGESAAEGERGTEGDSGDEKEASYDLADGPDKERADVVSIGLNVAAMFQ